MDTDKITAALGRPPETIAIFRAIKLGDLLVSIPALRALRHAFPQARISLISLPWAVDFVRRFPQYLDTFIPFPGWPGLPEQAVDAQKTTQFLQRMQRKAFDVVLQLQGNGTCVNPMMGLLGARLTAGYYPESLPQYCLDSTFYRPYLEGQHEIRRHVQLMEFLGIPGQGYDLEFPLTKADSQRARQVSELQSLKPHRYVCIHAGGISARRWPEYRFAEVADALAANGYAVVLTGTASEAPIIEDVRSRMKAPAISLAGKTDLGVIGWVLSRAALLVSNDTGVSHIASALKTPSVIIYSTSRPDEWGPLNQQLHRAVREAEATDSRRVIDEALNLLAAKPPHSTAGSSPAQTAPVQND
ncbi:glycosyltransferase family 9 protein [Larkinella knui]|uniref:Glycosyltransferase family 9 protein n=1 Tax=Larkinella knui TaxID=2025310 RepID=A0A3P1CZ31_9BACT|nr:glycosyltransferase family 9 protein [Larkinella knui]RRB18134.1 glycosyltransferase family 9 protein [Larkinella knui]